MLEYLIELDRNLFLWLNSFHNDFFDIIMYWLSHKFTFIPLYLGIIIALFTRNVKTAVIALILIILSIVLSDQISVHWFKNVFERLRPCHDPDINVFVHQVADKCGGKYGFVSSHAANTFALALFTSLFFNNRIYTVSILLWASLVSYSRIYLGVHFPADILGGALLGTLIGLVNYLIFRFLTQRFRIKTNKK